MKQLLAKTEKMQTPGRVGLLFIGTALLLMTACQKGVETPVVPVNTVAAVSAAAVTGFHINQSNVVLLEGNADMQAVTFSWNRNMNDNLKDYTIEAATEGTNFETPVELGTTDRSQVAFLVKDLNQKMYKLVPGGNSARVELRVRASAIYGKGGFVYSDAVALNVTTYQPYTEYPKFMKLPGNFQNWDLAVAPKIVSTESNGEYEGYVNFTNTYAQFMFVKGNQWETTNTFTHIGNNKFGFGGGVLAIFGGAGTYLVKASTNTNIWSYTKINTWGIHGTAVAGNNDPVMSYDAAKNAYLVSCNLQAGEFRFRANNNNAVTLGKQEKNGYDVPAADGANFKVTVPGNYMIYLNVNAAGNYGCSVVKQPNVGVNNNG